MSVPKQFGERIKISENPEVGNRRRVILSIRTGWNEFCDWNENFLSLEEAHDLHHALGRIIANAEK